jgi:hypothetical protein
MLAVVYDPAVTVVLARAIVVAAEPLYEAPDRPVLIVKAFATEPAEPVVFWFHVGTVPVNPEYGSPEQFVSVPDAGVPRAPPA